MHSLFKICYKIFFIHKKENKLKMASKTQPQGSKQHPDLYKNQKTKDSPQDQTLVTATLTQQ